MINWLTRKITDQSTDNNKTVSAQMNKHKKPSQKLNPSLFRLSFFSWFM